MRTRIAVAIIFCGLAAGPASAQIQSTEPPLAGSADAAAKIAAARATPRAPQIPFAITGDGAPPPGASPECPGCGSNGPYGSLTIGAPSGASSFDWQINDAGPSRTFPNAPGVAGPIPNSNNQVSGWTATQVTIQNGNPSGGVPPTTGAFTWLASTSSPFDFQMETELGPYATVGTNNDGAMSDFDPTQSYTWPFITFQGPYTGPSTDAQLDQDTVFDKTLFANSIPSTANFSWNLVLNNGTGMGGELDLTYSPVPEPGTLGLVAVGLFGIWRVRRRRGL